MNDQIQIELPFRPGLASAHELFEWCRENDIKLANQSIHIKCIGKNHSYLFFFCSEEDAAAFKLCWC